MSGGSTARIPAEIRVEISKKIMAHAVELGWEDLNLSERSSQYEKWATDPEIVALLSPHIPRERIRVWIKDGPMKEFVRARRGIGSYASYVPRDKPFEELIISRIFGVGWVLVPDSVNVKPLRFVTQNPETEDTSTVLWGTKTDLKHIVWAYLNMPASVDARLVLVATPQEPISANERRHMDRIASRLRSRFDYVTR
jgi:hypothetical protein